MEEEKAEALKKYLIKKTNEYKEEKIALGKRVYRFLAQGVGSEQSLPEEMKMHVKTSRTMKSSFGIQCSA